MTGLTTTHRTAHRHIRISSYTESRHQPPKESGKTPSCLARFVGTSTITLVRSEFIFLQYKKSHPAPDGGRGWVLAPVGRNNGKGAA